MEAILGWCWKLQGDSIGRYNMFCMGRCNYTEVMLLMLCKYWDTARELPSNCFFILIFAIVCSIAFNAVFNIYIMGLRQAKTIVTWVLSSYQCRLQDLVLHTWFITMIPTAEIIWWCPLWGFLPGWPLPHKQHHTRVQKHYRSTMTPACYIISATLPRYWG